MKTEVYVRMIMQSKGGAHKMGKRKIALLAATWDCEVLAQIVSGVKERLNEIGWDLHVFVCFPTFGIENPENFGNFNIFSLPNLKEYEGILLAINGVDGYDMLKKYNSEVFSCGKPMVSLEKEIEGITTIVPDGYKAVYHMVEHLITEHGCRTINYVGGMADHPDNIARKKAYMDALAVHGIPVEERRIREYSFVVANGREAYKDFKELGIECPDAVFCANDAMALGYCQMAEEDGKYPPEDFLIAGFDNDDNSKTFTPLITSVDKKAMKLGYVGCDELLKLIGSESEKQGKTVLYEPELVLRGSCGCYTPEELEEVGIREMNRRMYARLKEETAYQEMIAIIRQNLALANSEGMFNYFMDEIMGQYDISGYCLCINQEIYYSTAPLEVTWKAGYSKSQYVMSGMRNKKPQDEPMMIKTCRMYPEYLEMAEGECHAYIFLPVQKSGACVGYLAVVDGSCLLQRNLLRYIVSSIDSAYGNLRNLENLRKINRRLDNIYMKDAMTDLYNRVGYMQNGYEMYEKSKIYKKPLMVMFMDMDRLKYINDTFGHSHGDEALVRFAGVLKECAGEDKIAVRYGGDEFMIIGQVKDGSEAEAFKKTLEEALELANSGEEYPYRLEASIGYVLTDPKSKKELDAYVEEADSLMYEVKKRNKKQRA